jgi:hypothetical protein
MLWRSRKERKSDLRPALFSCGRRLRLLWVESGHWPATNSPSVG